MRITGHADTIAQVPCRRCKGFTTARLPSRRSRRKAEGNFYPAGYIAISWVVIAGARCLPGSALPNAKQGLENREALVGDANGDARWIRDSIRNRLACGTTRGIVPDF